MEEGLNLTISDDKSAVQSQHSRSDLPQLNQAPV